MATRQIAQGIAQLGRNGDSTLVHMQPNEVAGLQALAKSQGTSLTINPETGLPEAFSLGGFFESLAPTLAGLGVAMIPGMQPYALQAGIAAGAATGALTNRKNPLMGAVMGGMGGYGGANLANAASSFGSQAAKAGVDPQIAAVQSGFNAVPTNVGVNMSNPSAAFMGSTGEMGVNMGATNLAKPITYNTASTGFGTYNPALQTPLSDAVAHTAGSYTEPSALAQQASGFADNASRAYSNVAADPLKFIGQNKMAVGMPLAGAVLGGLEPSDLGYNSITPSTKGKYDPYATLNLNTNTGLKLYAQGGPISFADGGDALKGGGADAMQGAGMLPLDVSDINAKYGYSPDAESQPLSGMGLMSYGSRQSMPSVQVPVLGLFADNDQIEAARSAYESQLAAAMAGRGGMGSTANAQQMGRSMANPTGGPMATRTTGIAGLNSMGSTADTADTAPTAETALARLNLNKQYANGGTIQGGGLQDLYQTSDNPSMNPSLSRDGYGLGRLQQLADGGVAGFAKGGYLDGPGDGMSDSIPATIEGKQPARLADGEFVIPADVVSHLGNGSTKAGSKRLYAMLDKVRKARTGTKKQGKKINPNKFMLA